MTNALQREAAPNVTPRFRLARASAPAPEGVHREKAAEPKPEEPAKKPDAPIVLLRQPPPRFAARAQGERQAAQKNLAHLLQQRLPVDPDEQRRKNRPPRPLKKKKSEALDEVAPHVVIAVGASSTRTDVRASLEALLAHVEKGTLSSEELAIVMARRIIAENRLTLLEIPAALDAVMSDAVARPLVKALRKELGRAEIAVDRNSHGVRISFDELTMILGDVRDDRPAIDATVQRINKRLALGAASYAVLDLDPKIEATPLGRRILRRLPMLALALADARFDLGRIMLVVRAGSLAPYARLLDIARLHFRAVACPGMAPDVLDSVSKGASGSHLA